MSDLIQKLEGATEGSRELDGDLAEMFGPHWKDAELTRPQAPGYTTSMAAVVSLAKQHGFYINSEPRFHIDGERVTFNSHALRPRWDAWRPDDEWFDRGEAKHSDQVLSALIALLRALHPKEGKSHG